MAMVERMAVDIAAHLDGVLAIDRVDKAQRKRILRLLQDREMV